MGNRISSISEQVQHIQNAGPLPEPDILQPGAEKHFHAIISARPRNSWHELDVTHAAHLANDFLDAEQLRQELADQGAVLENGGREYQNPRCKILETILRRIYATCRYLKVHPSEQLGRISNLNRRSQREREFMEDFKKIYEGEDGDLLAKPPWMDED